MCSPGAVLIEEVHIRCKYWMLKPIHSKIKETKETKHKMSFSEQNDAIVNDE
jgi:hypothetical protein